MLEWTDAITNEVLDPITFGLAYPTVFDIYPMSFQKARFTSHHLFPTEIQITDPLRLTQFQITPLQCTWNYAIFKLCNFRFTQFKENQKLNNFLKGAPNFSLREWHRAETKVTGEYCWAITEAARLSSCVRSGSSVLKFGFQLVYPVHTYIVARVHAKLRLAQSGGPSWT